MGESLIQQRSFTFALNIIRLYKKLQARQEFVVSPQLLKSGTGIGLKVEQASAEQRHQAFVDKIQAASESARETQYWLKLLQESKLADIDVTGELNQLDEIIKILTEIVNTHWQRQD